MSSGGDYIVGHGVDVVDVVDFSCLMRNTELRYLDKYFTQEELGAIDESEYQLKRLAGRFAIKEAVMKALGIGWGKGVSFTDVEIITLESGAPSIVLKRELETLEKERQISKWLVSMSHSKLFAVASVIAIANKYNHS